MTLQEFAKLAAKEGKEGRVSKWIRRNPKGSRFLIGSGLAGAISAKKGQRIESGLKGLGADVTGGIASNLGALGSLHVMKKLLEKGYPNAALAAGVAGGVGSGLVGRLGISIPLARKWQKKHEKTGPTK